MRIVLIFLFAILLNSCAQRHFSQRIKDLSDIENQLISQKKEANQLASPDVSLFKGAYAASKNKNATPYPRIKILASSLESDNLTLSQRTDSCLRRIAQFKSKHGQVQITTKDPAWNDYSVILTEANTQSDLNMSSLARIKSADDEFDSLCLAHKIKRVPLLEYEAELAAIITSLEDEFVALQNTYQGFKREITSREDRESSMRALGEMRQKFREIESEQLKLANLNSRLSLLSSDTVFYQGPYIEKNEEILLIENQTNLLKELLGQLHTMEDSYLESE